MTETGTQEATPTHRSLVSKLAEVLAQVEHVAKRGRNDHFNYDFVTESDITAAVRLGMAERHVMMVPSIEDIAWREVTTSRGSTSVCRLTIRYTIIDGESGEQITFTMMGEGQDSGDKAVPKAITSCTKYALLKLFLIPTGDDPERTEVARQPQQRPKSAPPAPKPQAARTVDTATGEITDPPAGDAGSQRKTALESLRTIARKLKLTDAARRKYWELYCGEANADTVDPAAVSDFIQFLKKCEREGIDPNKGTE